MFDETSVLYSFVMILYLLTGENQTSNVCGLLETASRSKWEEDFAKRYIEPVIQVFVYTYFFQQNILTNALLV